MCALKISDVFLFLEKKHKMSKKVQNVDNILIKISILPLVDGTSEKIYNKKICFFAKDRTVFRLFCDTDEQKSSKC